MGSFYAFDHELPCSNKYTVYTREVDTIVCILYILTICYQISASCTFAHRFRCWPSCIMASHFRLRIRFAGWWLPWGSLLTMPTSGLWRFTFMLLIFLCRDLASIISTILSGVMLTCLFHTSIHVFICLIVLHRITPHRSINSTDAGIRRHRLTLEHPRLPWEFRMNIYVFPAALQDCTITQTAPPSKAPAMTWDDDAAVDYGGEIY